jgi:uncharacterized protein YutE (UPF0331/DUF86 family)
MNEPLIQKVQSGQRCVHRVREIYGRSSGDFLEDFDAQDAAILNLLRACEITIDLANHLIRADRLGVPASSAEAFELLRRGGHIGGELAARLKSMVGFRNIAVHQYRDINHDILIHVIEEGMEDLVQFMDLVGERATEHGRHPGSRTEPGPEA